MIIIDQDSPVVAPEDPIVLWDNQLAEGTMTQSSQTAGGEALNAVDGWTYDFWTPAVVPARIVATGLSAGLADTVGLAAHNLGSLGCGFRYILSVNWTRVNSVLNSQNFSSGWSLTNTGASSLTADYGRSPAGTSDSGLFLNTDQTISAHRRVYPSTNITVTATTLYYTEVSLRYAGHQYVSVNVAAGTALTEIAGRVVVDTLTMTIVSGAPQSGIWQVVPGESGWMTVRGMVTTLTSTAYRVSVGLCSANGGSTSGLTGAGVEVWGFHLESRASAPANTPGDEFARTGYIKSLTTPGTAGYIAGSQFHVPTDDRPIVMIVRSRLSTTRGIEVWGDTPPSIGVASVGLATQIPAGISPAYVPMHLAREIEVETSRTRTGQYVGNRILRRGVVNRVVFTPIHRDLVDTSLDDFIRHYDDAQPFFFAASPEMFPSDTSYVWRRDSAETMRPVFAEAGEFMSIGFDLEGVA